MGGRLSQEMAGIGKKLARHVTAVMEYNIQPLRTLTHYDYQLDNIFFPQSNATDTLIVVDWQLVTIGRGASDIAFFWPVT
jgi:aminoglycoside phosphotransferase (APT) family kinase protein